jgi:hypothetical protein
MEDGVGRIALASDASPSGKEENCIYVSIMPFRKQLKTCIAEGNISYSFPLIISASSGGQPN